jgi:outer membrane protein assembly factor BamB
VGFVPACTPVGASSSAPVTTPDDPRLDTLVALGQAPAWHVTFPAYRAAPGDAPGLTAARGVRIPGGFLIDVTAADLNTLSVLYGDSILMAMNDDGSVRWRQCRTDSFTGYIAVARGEGAVPTQAVIAVSQGPATSNDVQVDYRVIDLADGRDEGTVHDRAVAAGLDPTYLADQLHASGRHELLFTGRSLNDYTVSRSVDASDRIVRVNLDTMQVDVLPVPKRAIGMSIGSGWLRLSALGQPAVLDGRVQIGDGPAIAVYLGRRWFTSASLRADVWAAHFPVTVQFDFSSQDPTFQAVDSGGNLVWSRPDLVGVGGDSMAMYSSNGTSLTNTCPAGSDVTGCPDYALVAVDSATGTERWRAKGLYNVAFVANGMAMVQAATDTSLGPWQLLDMRTGARVAADQEWPDPKAFGNDGGCCFLVERTTADGAFVFHAAVGTLNIWAPNGLSGPTINSSVS